MADKKLNGTVIVTYRCNARCTMCNRYKAPSKPEEEISIETIKKLPPMYFTNITGGEPFIRTDLRDIVSELRKKSGGKYSMYENKIVRDLRDGKVTKEELDKCSTCDVNACIGKECRGCSKGLQRSF